MNNYRDGGKGDKPRPLPNKEQFDRNFESIFGKKTKMPQPEMKEEKNLLADKLVKQIEEAVKNERK
jgi:hypothetical protein